MKNIEINFDTALNKSLLSQALKVISLNNKDVIFNIKTSLNKVIEMDGYENILINNLDFKSDASILSLELDSKFNTYLIKSNKQKYMLLNLNIEEYLLIENFKNTKFISTFILDSSLTNNLIKTISYIDIFNIEPNLILIDNDSILNFINATKLFTTYFINQQKEKESKKGTLSKINDLFFKNFQSPQKTYGNLYEDIFLPFNFNITKDNLELFIDKKATISNYISSINILISILDSSLNLN